jgi:NADH:ubiquinone oxidoreductase subunit F (NADH-binding)
LQQGGDDKHGGVRQAYCLGYCDRAPAVLLPDDRLALRCPAHADASLLASLAEAQPARSDIRCDAREAIVTARLLHGDCSTIEAATSAGAYHAVERALREPPEWTLAQIERSGLRGRGGAGFPTGEKWRVSAAQPSDMKYVIANGDEGDPGSFIDRELMERDPHAILAGMRIAAHAVGARQGVVYIRAEYPRARRVMAAAVEQARAAGWLGRATGPSVPPFDVRVESGKGSYVCGEETALLNALEGKRGEVRLRPPYPAVAGLFGRPTVVDNVETLVNVPWIVEHGAEAYRKLGTPLSPGTKALCLNVGFARPGIVEVEFGVPLRRALTELGGGFTAKSEAVLIGGPMGSIVFAPEWDAPLCIDAMRRRGISLGHGGIVALPRDVAPAALATHLLQFMRDESCGKCVPCRLGSDAALRLVREGSSARRDELRSLLDLMTSTSLCAFGREAPGPVRQLLERFGDGVFAGSQP